MADDQILEEGERRFLAYGVIDVDRLLQWDEIKSVSGILFWSLLGHIASAGSMLYPEVYDGFNNFLSVDMEVDDKLVLKLQESRTNWLKKGIWANGLFLRLDKDYEWDSSLFHQTFNRSGEDDGIVLNIARLASLYLDAMKERGFEANDPEFQRFIISKGKTRNEEILNGRG